MNGWPFEIFALSLRSIFIKIKFREVPAREGRDSLLVVAGALPLATITSDGLMSKNDKKYGINYLYIKGTTLIKLCDANATWMRSGGFLLVSTGRDCALYVFTIGKTSDDSHFFKIKTAVAYTNVKFYIKGDSLYAYYNSPETGWANVFGCSNNSFVNMGPTTIDDTYTEILPEN